jgi:hypothetical protein
MAIEGVDQSDGEYQTGLNYDTFESMSEELGKSKQAREEGKPGSVLDTYYSNAVIAKLDEKSVLERIEQAKVKDNLKLLDNIESENKDMPALMYFIPRTEDGLTKAIRDLFKYPSMIIMYGGSISNVEKSVAGEMSNDFISKLVKDYYNEAEPETREVASIVLGRLADAIKIKSKDETVKDENGKETTVKKSKELLVAELLHETTPDKIRIGKSTLEKELIRIMKPAVGQAVGDAIKETFGDVLEATNQINKSGRYMYRVFERALKNELDKLGTQSVSIEVLTDIINKLKPLMPIFASPDGEQRLKDGIAIFDRAIASNDEAKYGSQLPSIKYETKDANGKTIIKQINVRPFVRRIGEAFAAAGVLPTHTEDATYMANTIKWIDKNRKSPNRKYFGWITPIHDATVLSGNGSHHVLREMNKNIGEVSRSYDMVLEVVNTMDSVLDNAKQYEIDNNINLNLDDMHTEDEVKKLKQEAEEAKQEYIPGNFTSDLITMNSIAEIAWNERRKIFARRLKIDQMVGYASMAKLDPIYEKQRYENELVRRILLRKKYETNKLTDADKKEAQQFAQQVLYSKTEPESHQQITDRILRDVAIIEEITKLLNGDC